MEKSVKLWNSLTIDISGFKNQINSAKCTLIELGCCLDDMNILEQKINLFEQSIKDSREKLCLQLLSDSLALPVLEPVVEPVVEPIPEPVVEVVPEVVLPEPVVEVVLPEPITFTTLSNLTSEQIAELLKLVESQKILS